jgi:hypothetical protein
MDKKEAKHLLERNLDLLRAKNHRRLAGLVGESIAVQTRGQSGTDYNLEIEMFWDAEPGGPIRVVGIIDDGGLSSLAPLSQDFVVNSD